MQRIGYDLIVIDLFVNYFVDWPQLIWMVAVRLSMTTMAPQGTLNYGRGYSMTMMMTSCR